MKSKLKATDGVPVVYAFMQFKVSDSEVTPLTAVGVVKANTHRDVSMSVRVVRNSGFVPQIVLRTRLVIITIQKSNRELELLEAIEFLIISQSLNNIFYKDALLKTRNCVISAKN